jgi:hypothetical protein
MWIYIQVRNLKNVATWKKKGGGEGGSKSQIQRSITVKYKNKRLLDGSSTPEHLCQYLFIAYLITRLTRLIWSGHWSPHKYDLLTLGIVCAMNALQCSGVLDPSNNLLFLYFTVMDLWIWDFDPPPLFFFVIYVMKKLGVNFITYLFVISHIY